MKIFFLRVSLFLMAGAGFVSSLGAKPIEIHRSRLTDDCIFEIMLEFLSEKPVVVQAGCYPHFIQRLFYFRPMTHFYMFEPNPRKNNHELRELLKWYQNAEFLPFALDDRSGKAPFYLSYPAANPYVGSLLPGARDWKWYYNDAEELSVQCVNLEEWAASRKIWHIDALWLNTGGTELRILQSIPKLLPTVKFLCVELYEQEFREGCNLIDEMVEFLEKNDFVLIQYWNTKGYQGNAVFAKKDLVEVHAW